MIPEASSGAEVDRRRFVRLVLRSAALGALGATGGYLAWRSVPPGRCLRQWPCAACGWRASCAWSDFAPEPHKSGG